MTSPADGILAAAVLGLWIGLGIGAWVVHPLITVCWLAVTVWLFRDEIELQWRAYFGAKNDTKGSVDEP